MSRCGGPLQVWLRAPCSTPQSGPWRGMDHQVTKLWQRIRDTGVGACPSLSPPLGVPWAINHHPAAQQPCTHTKSTTYTVLTPTHHYSPVLPLLTAFPKPHHRILACFLLPLSHPPSSFPAPFTIHSLSPTYSLLITSSLILSSASSPCHSIHPQQYPSALHFSPTPIPLAPRLPSSSAPTISPARPLQLLPPTSLDQLDLLSSTIPTPSHTRHLSPPRRHSTYSLFMCGRQSSSPPPSMPL